MLVAQDGRLDVSRRHADDRDGGDVPGVDDDGAHTWAGRGPCGPAGCVLALAAPGPLRGIAGWTVFGLGLATVAPVVLGAAAPSASRAHQVSHESGTLLPPFLLRVELTEHSQVEQPA